MDEHVSRRRLLATVGAGTVTGLAGCNDSGGTSKPTDDDTPTDGATLVFTDPTLGMLGFYGSDGLTVRNLTLDYDPVPFTQVGIASVSRDDQTVVVELEDGFSELEHRTFNAEKVLGSTHPGDGEFIGGITADRNPDKGFAALLFSILSPITQ